MLTCRDQRGGHMVDVAQWAFCSADGASDALSSSPSTHELLELARAASHVPVADIAASSAMWPGRPPKSWEWAWRGGAPPVALQLPATRALGHPTWSCQGR